MIVGIGVDSVNSLVVDIEQKSWTTEGCSTKEHENEDH
jgi:hypothetical protein